jgi:hypothetical protein
MEEYMYFYDRPDCIKLSSYTDAYGTPSGIFLFKNIIPEDLMLDLEKELDGQDYRDSFKYEGTLISWYANKMAPRPKRLLEFWEFVSELLYPHYVIHPSQSILNVRPGDGGMFTHSDSPGKGACHLLSQDDKYATCCVIDYGVVAYFGHFTGGEIFYPDINPDGTIKTDDNRQRGQYEYLPERGDIIIHSAFDPYSHGVKEVESGVRYAFSNFSLKAEDNPGTFYNYKTPEYYEQIGNGTEDELNKWMQPLRENPQFSKDRIIEMQQSGLEGKELAATFMSEFKEH